jgi:hypothetical protein
MIGFFNSIPTTIELNGPVLSFTGSNTLQPLSTSFCDGGTAGFVGIATATFPAQSPINPAENTGYIEYHWHEVGIGQLSDSSSIVGSATTFLILSGLKSPQDNGRKFFLRADYVNSAYGVGRSTGNAINESLDSNIVTLGMRPNIGITTQPIDTPIAQGASAKFSIGANATDATNSSLTYQWYANGNLLRDGRNSIAIYPSPNPTQTITVSGWNGTGIYLDLVQYVGNVNLTITTSEESGIFHYINIPGVANIPENLGTRTYTLQGGRIYGPCSAPNGNLYIGNETPVGGTNRLVVEEGGDDWNDMILTTNAGFFKRYSSAPQSAVISGVSTSRMTITNSSGISTTIDLASVTSYSAFDPKEIYTITTNTDVKVQAYLKGGKGGTSTYLRSVAGGEGGTSSGIVTFFAGRSYQVIRGSAANNSTAGSPGGGAGNGGGGGGGYTGLFAATQSQSYQSNVTHVFDNNSNTHILTQSSPDLTVGYMNPSAGDGLPCGTISYGKYYKVTFKVPFTDANYGIAINSLCQQTAGGGGGSMSVAGIANKTKFGFDIWFCKNSYNSYIRCFSFTTTGVKESISLANAMLIAGGGGGGSNDAEIGGAGGGTAGGNGQAGNKGGTQSSGGSGDNHAGDRPGSAGAALQGGSGAAGGGGGYYGGGGGGGYPGCCDDWAGGGGSGYIHPTLVTNGTFTPNGKNDVASIDGILVLDILFNPTSIAICNVSGATTPNLAISCDTLGTLAISCLVSHPSACNSPLLSNTVSMQIVNASQILKVERIEQSGTSSAALTSWNLYTQGEYTLSGSGGVNPALFSFYAAERDLDVFIDLYGGAGSAYGANIGGQGGVSTIRLTLKKDVEYVLAGLSAGGAVFLYRQATLIAVVGAGGNGGLVGAGGAGGGVNVSGSVGFGRGGGNGGLVVAIGGLTTNGSFGSAYPQASSALRSGDSNTSAPNGGRAVSCPKGDYWSGISPCTNVGNVQFYLANGTRITNSATIARGFKAGYGIRNTAGLGLNVGGNGGNGATGGAGGSQGGGGGGSGYSDGSFTITSTRQGGNAGASKVVIRSALV